MNFTSNISEKIKNITIQKNIIHIGEVKKFDGNIVYTDLSQHQLGVRV